MQDDSILCRMLVKNSLLKSAKKRIYVRLTGRANLWLVFFNVMEALNEQKGAFYIVMNDLLIQKV